VEVSNIGSLVAVGETLGNFRTRYQAVFNVSAYYSLRSGAHGQDSSTPTDIPLRPTSVSGLTSPKARPRRNSYNQYSDQRRGTRSPAAGMVEPSSSSMPGKHPRNSYGDDMERVADV